MNRSNSTQPTANQPRLDWHSGFYVALKAELVDYLDMLQFEQEHSLNEQPLRIDVLVIKVLSDREIKKNIAKIFRGHNLVEYKSPEDSLSVSSYIKTIGYGCLYQAIENVDYKDITITLVCTMKPEVLIEYLNDEQSGRYTVTEQQLGIYIVDGERFPVQIIENKLLSPDENFWLTSLKENADKAGLENALLKSTDVKDKINLGAFWYVVFNTNADLIKEVLRMSSEESKQTLEEALEEVGYNKKIEAKTESTIIALIKGLQKNIPLTQLATEIGMSVEKAEKIQREVYG